MADKDQKKKQNPQGQQDQEDQTQEDQEFHHDINKGTGGGMEGTEMDSNLTSEDYAEEAEEQGAMEEDEADQLKEGVK